MRQGMKVAVAVTLLSSAIWGSSFPATKYGLAFLDPYSFTFLRFLIGTVTALLLFPALRIPLKPSVFKIRSIWALGLLDAVAIVLQSVGLQMTNASDTALLVNLNVVTVAILSYFMFGEPLHSRKVLGVVSGSFGVLLLILKGGPGSLSTGALIGDILVFIAGFFWALFIILSKKVLEKIEPVPAMVWSTVITTIFLTPSLFVMRNLESITLETWLILLWTGVVCTTIAIILWACGLKFLTATTSSILVLFEVVIAIIISMTFLREGFTVISALGASLIMLAIFAVSYPSRTTL